MGLWGHNVWEAYISPLPLPALISVIMLALSRLKIKLQRLKTENQRFYDIPIYINIFIYIGIS